MEYLLLHRSPKHSGFPTFSLLNAKADKTREADLVPLRLTTERSHGREVKVQVIHRRRDCREGSLSFGRNPLAERTTVTFRIGGRDGNIL